MISVKIIHNCQEMSNLRQLPESEVLVRFWSLDHHRAEEILWLTSSWPKLVYCLEGTIHVTTHSTFHLLPPNRALWIKSNEPNPARTLGRAKVRTLYFSPNLEIDNPPQVLQIRPLFRELIAEACRVGPLNRSKPSHSSLSSLLIEEITSAPTQATSIPMPRSEWLNDWSIQYLKNPYLPLPDHFSRRTIERLFQRETSLTLGQWCQLARAIVGFQSISEGRTVVEASVDAGFTTPSGFIQAFRKQFGNTPGQILKTIPRP